jgi:hypothetical protein
MDVHPPRGTLTQALGVTSVHNVALGGEVEAALAEVTARGWT